MERIQFFQNYLKNSLSAKIWLLSHSHIERRQPGTSPGPKPEYQEPGSGGASTKGSRHLISLDNSSTSKI